MRKYESLSPLVKPAITVAVTVLACVVILIVVHPWRSDADHQAGSDYLSADISSDPVLAGTLNPAGRSNADMPTSAIVRVAKKVEIPPPPVRSSPPQPAPKPKAAIEAPKPAPVKPAATEPTKNAALPWSEADGERALKPLLSYEISEADIETLKDFVKRAFKEQYSKARAMIKDLRDPVAIKFAHWYYYRKKAPDTEAAEIIAFLQENPLWPGRDKLEESIEDALFWREDSPEKTIEYFAGKQPVSGTGLAALGIALIKKEQASKGEPLIRQAWRHHALTSAIEKRLRKLKVLKAEDHRARAGYLLLQDNKRYILAVKRVLPLIEKKWQGAVKAHIATVQRARNAGTLLTNLDSKIKEDPAILFARIQWLRRAGNDEKARELLLTAPRSAEELIDPEEWWEERQGHIRSALTEGNVATAYKLAEGHAEGLEHWDLSEAEFLAGWVAFRFQNKPKIAKSHFLAAAAAGGLPKRRSRAAYWLGRVESALGNMDEARARFAEAAEHYHTFYGQLAHQMIATGNAPLALRDFVRPSKQDIDQFIALDVMKALVIAEKADFGNLLALFMYDLARDIKSAPRMTLLCELAKRIAPPHLTVRMAKIAINRDFPVEDYAYPTALPDFKAVADGQDVEVALIHALTRQESEFNPKIVSSAGAVGLMQLLPSTAKLVARRHKVKYAKKKLVADPAYNVSLGSAFLHQLINNYDGSYIMALAGYNAGPGRVRRWAKEFGDPRKQQVDPIDWIERIPFSETRNYVHKIMESAQVYRSRLIAKHAPVRLAEDLHRGRKDKPRFMIGAAAN